MYTRLLQRLAAIQHDARTSAFRIFLSVIVLLWPHGRTALRSARRKKSNSDNRLVSTPVIDGILFSSNWP
jgi:hypothetical protein